MSRNVSRQAACMGAGAGMVIFAVAGLLPGSLLGGAAGIRIAGMAMGLPLEPGIVPRVVVLLSMLAGVLVSGIAITTATSTAGWLVGSLMESAIAAPTLNERKPAIRQR